MVEVLLGNALVILGATGPAQAGGARALDFLLGEWNAATQQVSGPRPGLPSAGTATGKVRYSWGLGGAWLAYEARFRSEGQPYEVAGFVRFDPDLQAYRAWAFNSLGVAIVYEGGWQDERTLVFTSTAAGARRARVVYRKREDGSVLFSSQSAAGDGPFEPYFEAVLTR